MDRIDATAKPTTILDGGAYTSPLWIIRLKLLAAKLRGTWKEFSKERIGVLGLAIIVIFAIMSIAHPILMSTVWDFSTYDPVTGFDFDLVHPAPPSTKHLLGTDPIGRDILSQLMFSARDEFILGLLAAVVTLFIATSVGAFSAYYSGAIDALLMRTADIVIMMPGLTLLIVLSTLWNLNFWSLAIIVGFIAGFGGAALVLKSQALTIKVKPYIEAARASGSSDFRIVLSHVVPNLLPLSFLFMMFTVTSAVFAEAILSFLGFLNVRMSWGIMLNTTSSQGYLLSGFETWWLIVPAGLAVTLLCGSFYLVGRGLDPIVNPRLRSR